MEEIGDTGEAETPERMEKQVDVSRQDAEGTEGRESATEPWDRVTQWSWNHRGHLWDRGGRGLPAGAGAVEVIQWYLPLVGPGAKSFWEISCRGQTPGHTEQSSKELGMDLRVTRPMKGIVTLQVKRLL